jgi:hypothetical protein
MNGMAPADRDRTIAFTVATDATGYARRLGSR